MLCTLAAGMGGCGSTTSGSSAPSWRHKPPAAVDLAHVKIGQIVKDNEVGHTAGRNGPSFAQPKPLGWG
ncbi:MAG: hypothetical protein V9G23_02860 [Giesbergeria sp.]